MFLTKRKNVNILGDVKYFLWPHITSQCYLGISGKVGTGLRWRPDFSNIQLPVPLVT